MKALVTGSAGFIGFHLTKRLLDRGVEVIGVDALTPYYDVQLKRDRNAILLARYGYRFHQLDITDAAALTALVEASAADVIIHLAAQAGVRYSIDAPETYVSSNVTGTANLLEACRRTPPRHLLFASSSSVYGGNAKSPFAETDLTDAPMSLYAATKKAGEAMTHAYASLWDVPTTCLRFFTVYGPWGRPDMALFKFTEAIAAGRPIDVYGQGNQFRDFTFVDDLIDAVIKVIDVPPERGRQVAPTDSLSPTAPWRSVNIAGGNPVPLMDFIRAIENATGIEAIKIMLPAQPGDVSGTAADTSLLEALIGSRPGTLVHNGVRKFVDWHREFYATRELTPTNQL